ncbi:SET domain-containing protein 5 [Sporothrix curviconia]|uniref:SET domain-containing protein 5 n=1 Tax=Sporothrix curviconia TaxID=1260050 RepID=A0ABP0B7P4_9PEZI
MVPVRFPTPLGAATAAAAALLAIFPASAVARESISNQVNLGVCQKATLGLEPHVCLQDGGAGSLGENRGIILTDTSNSTSNSDGIWSSTTPCYSNGTEGTEFCVYTSKSFADNHGITIMTSPDRAARFARIPAFADPSTVRGVNRDIVYETEHGRREDQVPLSYRVEAMPGKGYGVVATKHLRRGDLIMSTTASVVIDYALFDSVPEDEVMRMQTAAIDSLPALHHTRFMNLSTHDAAEGHEQIVAKILSTNAFDIEAVDGEDYGYFVVFPEISRLNHDCRPNADYHFDYDTLTQHIHAVRAIAAGEEITVSYMDLIKTRKQRLDKLKATWGFSCSCSLCTQNRHLARASDARIKQILDLRDEFRDYTSASRATPEMAELFISLYEQERLDAMLYEAYSYAAIEWNGAGEPWRAVKYARLAIETGLMSVGAHDEDVIEMRRLAADPWKHWSWMLRKSRRMQWGNNRDDEKSHQTAVDQKNAAETVTQ